MSPELEAAVADAAREPEGPVYWRGLLAIGPEDENFSDVLAKLIAEAKLALEAERYARGSPDEERRTLKLASGRRLFSAREAERQRRAVA